MIFVEFTLDRFFKNGGYFLLCRGSDLNDERFSHDTCENSVFVQVKMAMYSVASTFILATPRPSFVGRIRIQM